MSSWWDDLDLAYKFTLVFVALLIITILAGFIKVLYNRKRLAGFIKQEQLEAGRRDDTVELTQREKDEGDLFGIRAIEAGFFAGVAQSRPTSRAGSVMDVSVASSRTLPGGPGSPFMKNSMPNNSALSLQLGSSIRDSDTLGDNASRRLSPPSTKLRPSDAEMSGRRNHNGAVDMSLNVPPSPGYRGSHAASFVGSDDGESDGFASPRSASPNDAGYNAQPYSSIPSIQMPGALQVSYHDGPNPPSPGNPPETRLPTVPGLAVKKDSRSPSPQDQSHSEPKNSSSPLRFQSQVYPPTHQYSHGSEPMTQQPYVKYSERSQAASSTEHWDPQPTEYSAPNQTNAYLTPGANGEKEARLSEFYDSYYRNSLNPGVASDAEQSVMK